MTDDNQICQWYCCDCGQSYGTILYKDKHVKHDNQVSTVKYYSSILYNNNIVIGYQDLNSPWVTHEDEYFKVRLVNLNHSHRKIVSTTFPLTPPGHDHHYPRFGNDELYHDDNNSRHDDVATTMESHPSLPSHDGNDVPGDGGSPNPNTIPSQSSDIDELLIDRPKRFSCHRCQHMMCPYCPKLRYKDL